jgi:hypothetical protein
MNAKINAECTSEEAQAFLGVSDGPIQKAFWSTFCGLNTSGKKK